MKNQAIAAILIVASILISGCKTSNDVMSDNFIQKRKYTKGFYVERNGERGKTETIEKTESVTINQEQITEDSETEPVAETTEELLPNNEKSTVQQMKDLYSSDVKDVKTFRKEYKKIKDGFGKGLFRKNDTMVAQVSPQEVNQVMDGSGAASIISFISAILGFFIAGVILGILAIVLGVIGVGKGVYKGLAIAGIIIGIIDVIGALIIISTL